MPTTLSIAVHDDSEHVLVELENDEAFERVLLFPLGRKMEEDPKIDHRDDLAAQVVDAADERSGVGNVGEAPRLRDLLHAHDVDAVFFARERESHHLEVDFVRFLGRLGRFGPRVLLEQFASALLLLGLADRRLEATPFFELTLQAQLEKLAHVDDEANRTVAEDGGSGDAGRLRELVAKRLYDHVLLADEGIHHEADALVGGADDDDEVVVALLVRRYPEEPVEPEQGDDVVSDVEDLVVVDHPDVGGLDPVALDDAGDRDGVDLFADAHEQALDDGQGEGELDGEAACPCRAGSRR